MSAPEHEPMSQMGGNPGETLRVAREQKGWSLQLVAQRLNLPTRSVEHIEAGDFGRLPGHTFARGYVRAYAKLLELDPNRLVNEFDRYTGTEATGSSTVQSLGRIEEPGRLSRSVMRVFGFLLLLLLVGASLYWWQERSGRDDAAAPVSALERIEVESADGTTQVHVLEDPEEQEVDEAVLPLSPAAATDETEVLAVPGAVDELANDQAQAASAEAAAEPSSVESSAVDSPSQPVAPQPAEQAEAASPAQAEMAAAEGAQQSGAAQLEDGEGRLELRFVADCWVRVTAADGRQLLSTVGKAGSERTVVGTAPLNVHLGFARGAVLTYNGNPVDVSPFIRGETARLTLGQ